MVITTAHFHSTKFELRFCAGSLVPIENEAKRLSLRKYTTEKIDHHHNHYCQIMPSLFNQNYYINELRFMIWIMSWNMNYVAANILFFSIQHVKSNCYITLRKFLPIVFFWWVIYSFSFILIVKALFFLILCGSFLTSS